MSTADLVSFSAHAAARKARKPAPPTTPADTLDIPFLQALVAKPKFEPNDMILLAIKGGFDMETDPEATMAEHVLTALMEVKAMAEEAEAGQMTDEDRRVEGILSASDMTYMAFLLDRLLVRLVSEDTEE